MLKSYYKKIQRKQDYLLAAHLFFDFSTNQWEKFLGKKELQNPFQEKIFISWKTRTNTKKENWKQALEASKVCAYKRITYLDETYPKALRLLSSPPPVLYLKGAPIPEVSQMISVVGTRKPSAFGKQNAQDFTSYYAKKNHGIVSGLARGIDRIAHECALREKQYTLAILGSGFRHLYPREHQKLASSIIEAGGTILSPYAPDAIPFPSYFPRRNWLIAALSAGTIVVEGGPKGGANITGRYALELGHSCAVLTQDFRSENGKGAIELIRVGASPLCSVEESYEILAFPYGGKLPTMHETKIEK